MLVPEEVGAVRGGRGGMVGAPRGTRISSEGLSEVPLVGTLLLVLVRSHGFKGVAIQERIRTCERK